MKDPCGTNQELIKEISTLQQRIKELEHSEAQRKRAEEALESERTLLQNLIDNVPDRIYAKDAEGRFIICNEAMIRRMGMTSITEIVGKSDFDLLPLEMAQRFHADEQAIIQSGIPMINREEPLTTEGGKITRWNLATKVPLLDKQGNRIGIVGVGREITDRKQVEEALRESEERYRTLVENATDLVFRTDNTGRLTFVNPATLRITGYEEKEIIGKQYTIVIRPDMRDEAMKFFGRQFVKRIQNTYSEYPMLTKNGQDVWFGQNTQLIVEDDNVTGFQVVARDITERKRIEEALQESEKRYRELSIVDGLTQLYNSRHFYFQLKIELDRSNRYGQPLTLLLLDLDDFKAFNDAYGHVEGDQVLMRLGQVVKRCLRETDFAFRYGGEEFTILLPMTTNADGAVTAERIRTEFKKETFSSEMGQDVHVTVSIGIAQYKPQEEMKAFVHRVDQLMYQGKKKGKDRVCSES
jgi:diguanylate cyclase (GGDEF)-like protein/PAS domain S-box-containing protein